MEPPKTASSSRIRPRTRCTSTLGQRRTRSSNQRTAWPDRIVTSPLYKHPDIAKGSHPLPVMGEGGLLGASALQGTWFQDRVDAFNPVDDLRDAEVDDQAGH